MSKSTDLHADLKRLYPRLWRFCFAISGAKHTADDLAQTSCLRVLDKQHQFTPGTSFDSWVFRIAKNTWINELRANAIRRGGGLVPAADIDIADEKNSPEANLMGSEALLAVMDLPEAHRTTTFLVYVEGYSYKEAAHMLDVPIGTIMSRLAASRKRLANALSAHPLTPVASEPG